MVSDVTSMATSAILAPSGGVSVFSPAAGSVAASSLESLESHITGWGASNTVPPEPVSVAVSPPPTLSFSFSNEDVRGSWSSARLGLAAAFAFFTTRMWEKPSALAVTLRSTPGRTFAYVAVEPSSFGLGSFSGQSRESVRPSFSISANVVSPPPENDIAVSAALGACVPFFCSTSVVSMSVHLPFLWVRIGWTYSVVVKVPSGLATVVLRSSRRVRISTGLPDFAALARAWS